MSKHGATASISSKAVLRVVFLDHRLVLSILCHQKQDLLLHFALVVLALGRCARELCLAVAGCSLLQTILSYRPTSSNTASLLVHVVAPD